MRLQVRRRALRLRQSLRVRGWLTHVPRADTARGGLEGLFFAVLEAWVFVFEFIVVSIVFIATFGTSGGECADLTSRKVGCEGAPLDRADL